MEKQKKECAVCGITERVYFSSKHKQSLCRVHAYEMDRYGEIQGKGEKACEICGETQHAYYRKNYQKVLCRKHEDHMRKYGEPILKTPYDKNEIIISGESAEIILVDRYGKETGRAIIDGEDVEKVREIVWRDDKNRISGESISGRILLHRHIMNCEKNLIVFHKNGNYYDNRKSNLQVSTRKERNLVRKRTTLNSSGYSGVRWVKAKNKWSASITVDGHLTYLGHFEDIEDAIRVRLQGEKDHYGDFAPQKHLFDKYNIK